MDEEKNLDSAPNGNGARSNSSKVGGEKYPSKKRVLTGTLN